jgi:ribosomal protein L32
LIAYIDGLNLYHGLRQTMGHRWLWLDVVELVRSLRPASDLVRVNYYTAMTVESPDAQSRQQNYLKALAAANPAELRIQTGRYQRRSHLCENCGHKRVVYEEKETDVHVGAQLVADAVLARMDDALVVSGDADYLPAIRIAQAAAPGVRLVGGFPPGRVSKRIQAALPASFVIGEAKIRRAQLPDTVLDGPWAYARPAKWSAPPNPAS